MRRPRRVPMWQATVYLKGGNWFPIVAEEISVKRKSEGGFSEVGWVGLRGRDVPVGFDLREVQAVTAHRYGSRWALR